MNYANQFRSNIKTQAYFAKMRSEMEFAIAISTLSVCRYITDVVNEISLSAMDRILHRNDMICAMVDLIEKAPWLKKSKLSGVQIFDGGQWKKGDVELISTTEGQVQV